MLNHDLVKLNNRLRPPPSPRISVLCRLLKTSSLGANTRIYGTKKNKLPKETRTISTWQYGGEELQMISTFSTRKFRLEILDHLWTLSFQHFPVGRAKIVLQFTFWPKSDFFWANGKQPLPPTQQHASNAEKFPSLFTPTFPLSRLFWCQLNYGHYLACSSRETFKIVFPLSSSNATSSVSSFLLSLLKSSFDARPLP